MTAHLRPQWLFAALLALLPGLACQKQTADNEKGATATAPAGDTAATLPSEPPATEPAATAPAKPESTYSSKPPYPVHLYVLDPAEEQPGWLRIEELINPNQMGELTGSFPERNKLYVDTVNVRRIRIHISHLPLAEGRRIALQLDRKGMELTRKDREYVTLELRPTGAWESVEEQE